MHPNLNILGHNIPLYGLMIAAGMLISGSIAYQTARERKLDADGLLALIGYAILGGFIGAKLLYLATEYRRLDFSRILDPDYSLSLVHAGGFVVIGGLAAGFLAAFLAAKFHHLDLAKLLENTIFALPLAQGFGRIGCFFAGCCYGVHYDGILSVSFPDGSLAGAEPRLAVQLISAFLLFNLSFVLYLVSKTVYRKYSCMIYLSSYALLRFIVEFFRGDEVRGIFAALSLSQYLSLLLLSLMAAFILFKKAVIRRTCP